MREEVLIILKETKSILEEKNKKELEEFKNRLNERTKMLEENIYRVLSSQYLEGNEILSININFVNPNIIKNQKLKELLKKINDDKVLLYNIGDTFIPVYYLKILDNLLDEGINIKNKTQNDSICYNISINRDYYSRLINRNLSLK